MKNKSLIHWGGHGTLNRLQNEFNRIFEDFGLQTSNPETWLKHYQPRSEVSEDSEAYYIKLDIPGIPKEKIKIEVIENQLKVSGEREEEKKGSQAQSSEIFYGSFVRSFLLPHGINSEKIEAHYRDGVLTIKVLKGPQTQTHQIPVK